LLSAFLIACGAFTAATTDAGYGAIDAATAQRDDEPDAASTSGAVGAGETPSPTLT
jgi:hypothetical protein